MLKLQGKSRDWQAIADDLQHLLPLGKGKIPRSVSAIKTRLGAIRKNQPGEIQPQV